MIIEKESLGFDGEYIWLIDGEYTRLSDSEIFKLVGKEKENEFLDLCESHKYSSFSIKV